MTIELARLELREIIRWGQATDADEELLAKLIAILYGATVAEKLGGGLKVTPVKDPPRLHESDIDQRHPHPAPGDERTDTIVYMVLDERLKAQGWTEEDVATVNKQREIAVLSARRQAEANQGPSVGEHTRQFPDGYGIVHTSVGQKNRVGDICIGLTADGYSIFKCGRSETHTAYAAENPVRPGCPQCFMGGGGGGEARDESRIPGEETF